VSVGRCIPELLAQGKLTKTRPTGRSELFDGHSAELGEEHVAGAAEAVASKRTLDALDFEALERAGARCCRSRRRTSPTTG
jgi:hypothetical protein